ncbi:Starch-binding associating with outer membrane [Maribacter dokdonensis]|uniref:RagB/SusD family nutrient uptake outer membrane protein n=1 Tax=Maribacter dokdonensis TaxID=320912 RepID=UPI001B111020|nr:RagB/SusD family nutrient uptake outer membrane protein [Maribacter dokdonensis]CAG2532842.1 Starch-binding associating with outer membrane [Maribacter dokdonensis]
MKNKMYMNSSTAYFIKNYLNSRMFQIPHGTIALLFLLIMGCSDFVEVGPPKNILVSETVFNDAATVESALANIYFKMREQGMVSGNFGITTGIGIYSDELDYYAFDAGNSQLYLHNVLPSNEIITGWWSQSYNLIYSTNDVLKGVENSNELTVAEKDRFKGQALVVRSYIYGLLTGLYGDVPYITGTDYLENNIAVRTPEATVKENILSDLQLAIELLEGAEITSVERVVPDQWAAKALLARMYLYTENWERAALMATELIDNFSLETDLTKVFLKESPETIWQLKDGENPKNTQVANQLVIRFIPGQTYSLTNQLSMAFETGDLRKINWTDTQSDTDSTVTLRFAHKYKATLTETESLEYFILLRLAEQYLIRAEARTRLGDISGALLDLNTIRNRAGLPDSDVATANELLDAILRERRVELFTELGLRWLDLKRTDTAGEVLSGLKANWKQTDVLLPIPETELEINPNLLPQNPGY